MFKADQLKLSVDTIRFTDLVQVNLILQDFNMFTSVQLSSNKCTPAKLEKLWLQLQKAENENADLATFEKVAVWNRVQDPGAGAQADNSKQSGEAQGGSGPGSADSGLMS